MIRREKKCLDRVFAVATTGFDFSTFSLIPLVSCSAEESKKVYVLKLERYVFREEQVICSYYQHSLVALSENMYWISGNESYASRRSRRFGLIYPLVT